MEEKQSDEKRQWNGVEGILFEERKRKEEEEDEEEGGGGKATVKHSHSLLNR